MTASVGYLAWEATYRPFGESTSPSPPAPNHYLFTGFERDAESALDHTWFRQYSSAQARWLSPDPLGGTLTDPQSLNRYSYVLNDPLNYVDPLGLCAFYVNRFVETENGPGYWTVDGYFCGGGGGGGAQPCVQPGRVTETTFPSTLVETYAYDAVGNLTSRTDRKNQTIEYVYDALGRLTEKTYPDSTSVEYVYDLAGKLQEVSDPTGTYAFTYDYMGRLTGTTTDYSFLTSRSFTNAYAYDKNSNRTGFTDPEGGSTTYAYDTLNRLTTLTPPSAISSGNFGFSYDALSRRTQMTRPNGVNTDYTYDNLSRLLSVLHKLSGSTIDGATYTVDAVGNRTQKANQLSGGPTENYTYDSIYQLTQVAQAGPTTTESYSYDPVGNRLSSLAAATWSHNASNQLTSISGSPGTTFTYDSNGNTLTKTDSTGTTTYAWDYENRLTSVTLPSTAVVSFKYDPKGRRVQKATTSTTTVFAYDGRNIVEETNAAGTVQARFAVGLGVDKPLAQLRGGATHYYVTDGLGSVTSLTNSSGTVAASYTYDAFGNVTTLAGSVANPFRYTAREWDTETDLYFYRARYYDSKVGRFTSEDPLGFGANDQNFYRYVNNVPTLWTDPTGLKVYRCSRKAIVNVLGFNINIFGFSHTWIKSDTKEVGLGPGGGGVPGVPGQPGAQGTSSDSIGMPTTLNDHRGASDLPGVTCEEVSDIDENCVNKLLQIGSYQGPFGIPPTNNCQTVARDILTECSTKPKPKRRFFNPAGPAFYD